VPGAGAEGVAAAAQVEVAQAAQQSTKNDITHESPGTMAPNQALQNALTAALATHPKTDAAIAVLNLDDGRWAAHDSDRVFYAASTFKLAVLYEAERRIGAGELSLDDRVILTEEALAEDLGTIEFVPVAEDGSVSVEDALTAMIELSDNATGVALLGLLGPAAIDKTLRELGLTSMAVNTRDLPATASDL